MPLMAHKAPRIEVPLIGDNTVSVRGLNLDDFMTIMPQHVEGLSKIAELYAKHKEAVFSSKATTDFLIAVAKDFPGIVMEVISAAADEPEAHKVKLGTGLQLAVLTAIMKLTVEEAGGLGNLFARLRDLGANVLAAQAELRGASPKPPLFKSSTGSGESK